jgi:hypothetical protein
LTLSPIFHDPNQIRTLANLEQQVVKHFIAVAAPVLCLKVKINFGRPSKQIINSIGALAALQFT